MRGVRQVLTTELERGSSGNVPEKSVRRWWRRHSASSWRDPRAVGSKRWPLHVKVDLRGDGGGGGGKRFGEEVAVMVVDMQAIPPHVLLANKRFGKLGAEGKSDVVGGHVVGQNVGGGRGEERRRFDEGDVRRRNVLGEEFDDLGLYVGCGDG